MKCAVSGLLVCMLTVVSVAQASDLPLEQEVEWMALLLEGQKTGHLRSVRTVYPDRVVHEQTVHITIKRSGVSIAMTTIEGSTETRDGKPLAFFARQQIGGGEMLIEGVVENGIATVTTDSGGSLQTQQFPWPEGAMLSEALRIATLKHGLEPDSRFTAKVFIPSSLQATEVEVIIGEPETVDLFGVEMELTRTEQVMDLGQTTTTAVAWVNEDLVPKKMRFSIMGMSLETIACPERCATAMEEPAEFFTQAFARSPDDLDNAALATGITYEISPKGDADLHFPQSDEQWVELLDDGSFRIRIQPVRAATNSSPFEDPDPDPFLGQTRWLQTDAPEIARLADEARGNATAPDQIMQRLERFVRDYVSDKNLSVGYATALETARNRSGDCTEHALLLAALGRASGIPTRIATGVAYVDRWLGAEDVFVPHAWTQALIDGRWVSYDAALGGFDAGHIALSYGNGDPWDFYDGVNTLGNFEITSVTAAPVAP